MDEKDANTFPFHNLPPELKKIISKVFPVLFHLSFWIKEKSVATLANRNNYDQTQNIQSQFSHRITLSKGQTLTRRFLWFRGENQQKQMQ